MLYPVQPIWEIAHSDTVERFAYIKEYGDLLIVFKKGGEYRYFDAPESIVRKLRGKAHVWSKVRADIEPLRYEKILTKRTEPLKGRGNNKTMYGKAVATTDVSKSTPKVTRSPRKPRTAK